MTEFAKITEGQKMAWSQGDLGKLAAHLPTIYAELLCEELGLRPGERVVDVAAGTGTVSIAAARRFCDVTATDFVPDFLAQAVRVARAEGVDLETAEADAQNLPFPDEAFDAVISTFGAMFAPDQPRAAGELLRVRRPGGRIGVTAWVPDGVIARYAAAIGKYLPRPSGLCSPFGWGTREGVEELFGDGAATIKTTRRALAFRFPSTEFAVEYFVNWYGPARGAMARVDSGDREALLADMRSVWDDANQAQDGTLAAFAEYLETIIVKA